MKKLFLLAASACLFAVSANAQLRYGPEIGLNVSKFDFDPDMGEESTNIGLRIGAAMDICITDHFTIQPGIYYSMRGGESDFTLLGNDVEYNVNLGYIEIPLLAEYYINAGPGRFFLGLGPTASIAISGKTKTITTTPGGVESKIEDDIDFGSDINQLDRSDIGLMFNVGYDFDMGLFIRPFYHMGLSNLSNNSTFDAHNRTFGVGVGWWFGDDL
ncbi:porin family protein [Polluticoccus soli]|uniref:porin family protein n=1 Tax=Polluticoccus soli TaxID=3034150 RepID=UPI0023E1496A|nr:porin family protein [Flavipsychrobacter sp. JY13-12]